jgi:AcrR family transcriptional regulator
MPRIPQKLREDRREAIVQAAVECLARDGYAGTTMRGIAEAVGLTKGGLYPYFENKDAILVAVAERYLARIAERLAPHDGVSAAEQLAGYLDAFEEAFDDQRTVAARRAVLDLWLSAGDNPVVRAQIEHRFQVLLSALADLVRRGQDEGAFRGDVDPGFVAGLVLAARDGMLFQTTRLGVSVPVGGVTALLKNLLAGGLAPERPRDTASFARALRLRVKAGVR